jgi:hypothetical protein
LKFSSSWIASGLPAELEILHPLEEVIHIPAAEEGLKLLEKVMPTARPLSPFFRR